MQARNSGLDGCAAPQNSTLWAWFATDHRV